MYAVKVAKRNAQKKIDELRASGNYDSSRKAVRDDTYVFLPVKKEIKGAIKKELPSHKRITSLKKEFGISSFDVIGDIAVVLIPEKQWKDRDRIAHVDAHQQEIDDHLEILEAAHLLGEAHAVGDHRVLGAGVDGGS